MGPGTQKGHRGVVEPSGRPPELSTRERQRQDTHQRIYGAAAAEIRRSGLAGLSVANVARAAGVARQTFYDHFPTPDAIVDEAFRRYRTDIAGRLDVARLSSAPLGEVLHAVVAGLFGAMDRQSVRMRQEISAYLARGVDVAAWLDEPLFRLVADAAERAQLEGAVSSRRSPEAVARLALTALSGFVMMETEPPSQRAQRAHDTVELLVAGLHPDDGGRP